MAAGYPGSYAGSVVDVADPLQQHRLLVLVPAIDPSPAWAAAMIAPDGNDEVELPAVGDTVAITFEAGDSDHPVWSFGAPDPNPATSGWIGTYRALVVDDQDPEGMQRIAVQVPVLSDTTAWARKGPALGDDVAVPPVGSSVWVEFDGGSPDYPLWVGLL